MKVITCNLDRRIWRDLMKKSGMISLIHAATRDKWSRNLERGDIPARLCNIRKKSPYLRTSSSLNMAVRRGLTRFARPAGSLFAMLSVCPTGCAATRPIPGPRPYGASAGAVQNCSWQFCVEPRSGLLIPAMLCNIRKKSPYLRTSSFLNMAVRRGFEPRIRCRIHTFQACSFSHSDTSPYCCSCATGTGANVGETPPRRQSTF